MGKGFRAGCRVEIRSEWKWLYSTWLGALLRLAVTGEQNEAKTKKSSCQTDRVQIITCRSAAHPNFMPSINPNKYQHRISH